MMEPWLAGMVVGILAAAAAGALIRLSAQRRRTGRARWLESAWGTGSVAGVAPPALGSFLEVDPGKPSTEMYRLDGQTWSDLDMDAVFAGMDHCVSRPGSQVLYAMLHEPLLDEKRLDERWEVMEAFRLDRNLRLETGLALWPLQELGSERLIGLLWRPLHGVGGVERAAPVLAVTAAVVTVCVLLGVLPVALLLGVFALNTALHFLHKRRTEGQPVGGLAVLAAVVEDLARLDTTRFGSTGARLQESVRLARRIHRRLWPLLVDDGMGLVQYLKILFLVDVLSYGSVIRFLEGFREQLQDMFRAVGQIDALRAMASYLDSRPISCQPEHHVPRSRWAVHGLVHPLLDDPVPCDFVVGGGAILITGSNMSGKTTFLKSLGVNAVLAQVCHRALAKTYSLPLLRVITSIGRSDNLIEGRSYYMAEVESIARIVRATESAEPHLMLLDEIFRGTNTAERIAAGCGVLSYLANGRHLVFVATHDGELVDLLRGVYEAYHFSETVGTEGLSFDYTIRPGPSTRSNAIALLEMAGFPPEVLRQAGSLAGIRRSPG